MWDPVEKLLANVAGQDRAESIGLGSRRILVVADGAGGTGGGEPAAQAVVDAVAQRAASLRSPEDVVALLAAVDRHISSTSAGQTTAVVVCLDDSRIFGASVGDSAAWLVRERDCVDLTENQVRKPLVGTGSARAVAFDLESDVTGTLVVGSDGLFKYAELDRLCAAARGLELSAVPSKLLDLVRLPSGGLHDDVAIVVARRAP